MFAFPECFLSKVMFITHSITGILSVYDQTLEIIRDELNSSAVVGGFVAWIHSDSDRFLALLFLTFSYTSVFSRALFSLYFGASSRCQAADVMPRC